MNRLAILSILIAACNLVVMGCAGGGSPLAPASGPDVTGQTTAHPSTQTHLWGFYDVYMELETKEIQATLNRQAMFTANVVNFVNGKVGALAFTINSTAPTADYVDVDIDVSITHPFPGLTQYNGYDVRGVFMGDGSTTLEYNPDLICSILGTDQFMLADPIDGFGAPDGYTRWFNKPEFFTGGMPLFQYTQGKFASAGYSGTATLNPYRYFADGLGATEDLWTWLGAHAGQHGVFSSGATNTRNYYLRFPNAKGVKYSYAIIADWSGEAPEHHPSNAPEAIALKVSDSSDVYYVSPSKKGGDIILDVSIWDWGSAQYKLYIESTVLSGVHAFTVGEMTPIGGGENFSTYHVEIPADNVSGIEDNEYWVIAESIGHDYTNDFGVANLADTDPLAALFRYDLHVLSTPVNHNPVCDLIIDPSTPVPATDLSPVPIMFDASGSSDPDGDTLTFAWDFNGDGIYGGPEDTYHGVPAKPTHGYVSDYDGKAYVKVTDGNSGEAICDVDVVVTAYPSKNLPLRPGVTPYDLAFESGDGDLTILYADDWVYKHLASEYYQTGHPFYQKLYNTWPAPQFHESDSVGRTGNGGYVTVSSPPWSAPQVFYYKENAASSMDYIALWSMQFEEPMPANKYIDLVAFGPQGSFADQMGGVYGYDEAGSHWIRIFKHQYSANYFNFTGWVTNNWSGSVFTGYDKLYWQYVVAVTTDKTGDYIWFLENTDFYASRWLVTGGSLIYNNAYFGTGTQTDPDNGWNGAVDITRDDQNRLFVLDKLSSGQPRIKMWTVSGNATTSKGGFGDSTTIAGTPLRIEGGDFSGRIFVLHGDVSGGFMLSIFSPVEMPES